MSTTSEQVCHCSCGRTFVHQASLTRHCFVTGHEPVALAPSAEMEASPMEEDGNEVYARALAILEAKIEEQRVFDQQLANRAAAEQAAWMPPAACDSGPTLADVRGAVEAVACATRAATSHLVAGLRLALNLVAMLLFVTCLLASGVKIGGMLADSSSPAEAGSPVRQLVGARG